MPSANEDSIQTNIDQLLQRIMQARMQQDPGAEDDAERDYRCNTSTSALWPHPRFLLSEVCVHLPNAA